MTDSPETSFQTISLTVPLEAQGLRLDRWLAKVLSAPPPDDEARPALGTVSRSQLQRWIKDGHVRINDEPVRPAHKLEGNEQIHVQIPQVAELPTLLPEDIPLTIIYEDSNLLIVDKPAGLVVHPAPGHPSGTLVNAILHHAPDLAGVGGERRPGIVHRLDKDTSGLIAVAKTDLAHRHLQAQFQARTVYKEYLALLEGSVSPERGRIAAPLGRHPTERKRQAILPADPITGESKGRDAITEYETISHYSGKSRDGMGVANFTFARLVLHTGRTHQIRVHMAWRKNPVVGDATYGYRKQRLAITRQFLHAHRLRLRLPHTDAETEFVSPLPTDLQRILDALDTSS